MKSYIRKHLTAIVLLAIMLLAFSVRYYHFHDWLFFKWDQARDATLLSKAITKGPSELPLLGPRATKVGNGEFLRLGPAYYYAQYASGTLFNSTIPDVFAYPDLLFSILVLPALYLLLRLYFSRYLSLTATSLYAFSFIIIQHSRFSWNPNSVPFFSVIALYSLIRFFHSTRLRNRIFWISLWAANFAVASQFHFFAFFTLLGATGLFFLIRFHLYTPTGLKTLRVLILSKQTALFIFSPIAVISLLYTPVIISDVMKGGQNTKAFVKAFSTKPKDKPFTAKVSRNVFELSRNSYLLVTGYGYKKSESTIPFYTGLIFIILSLLLIIKSYRREKDPMKKDFLLIIIVWLIGYFIITIPMSYQLRPRYFSPIFPIPFIFIALWLSSLKTYLPSKKFYLVSGTISFLFLSANLSGTFAWYKEQALSQKESIDIDRTLILKRKDGITLGQFERAVDLIYSQNKSTNQLTYFSRTEYTLPIDYLFSLKNDPRLKISKIETYDPSFAGRMYAIVTVRGGFNSLPEELQNNVKPIESIQIGQLMVIEIMHNANTGNPTATTIPPQENTDEEEALNEEDTTQEKPDDRLYWKDIF